MNEFMKILLSLSVSGALLLLLILGLKPLYKNKFSKRWQYYIWIVVALRFLLPFTPDTTIVGSLFEKFDTAAITNEIPTSPNVPVPVDTGNGKAEQIQTNREITTAAMREPFNIYVCLFFIWSAFALVLFVRKITVYQGFTQYIKAGNTEVSDIKVLNLLSGCEEKLNIKTRVELSYNSLIASPIMIGFFRPRIVLPVRELEDKELSYIFVHELIHYKQRDMFYKWLIQIVVCVHWFNPFVYLLEKEVNKSCELSCDEKAISILDDKAKREYGDTLISFLKSDNLYKSSLASVTLTEGAEQLKERLGAIMNFKKKGKALRILTGVLTVGIIFAGVFVGNYHEASASTPANIDNDLSIQSDDMPAMETLEFRGTTYYLVFNEAQLRAIGTGEYGMNQNYMQQADIQLSTDEWVPIGTWDNPFTGTFNGNGFEIAGLTMTDPDAEIIGLFGVAQNAHIYNVILRDCDITSAGRNITGKSVGAILAIGQGSRSYDNFVYPKEIDYSIGSFGNIETLMEDVCKYMKNLMEEEKGLVIETASKIVEANVEVSLSGITKKNEMTIYPKCIFPMSKGNVFYIEYGDSVSGTFHVGLIDENGEKLEAETTIWEEGDTTSIEINQDGSYYFYIEGFNDNAGWFNTTYNFIVSYK